MNKILTLRTYVGLLAISLILLSLHACVDDKDRDAFIGNYQVSETCNTATDSYTINITALETNDNTILIYNLWDWGDYISGECTGKSLEIHEQNINGIIYKGSGTLDGSKLTIDLTITDGVQTPENCVLVCTRI